MVTQGCQFSLAFATALGVLLHGSYLTGVELAIEIGS
jgi:hypothetical protein